MDNKQFLVNGANDDFRTFEKALDLLFGGQSADGWFIDKAKGFVVYWNAKDEKINPFPTSLDSTQVAPLIWNWLQLIGKDFTNERPWESLIDMDGSQETGWTIYVDGWGHIDDVPHGHYAIGAVRPSWCWYGK